MNYKLSASYGYLYIFLLTLYTVYYSYLPIAKFYHYVLYKAIKYITPVINDIMGCNYYKLKLVFETFVIAYGQLI